MENKDDPVLEWKALFEEARRWISEDVHADRDLMNAEGYLGPRTLKSTKRRSIHPLELPGSDQKLNHKLIDRLAGACANWSFHREQPSWVDLQLDEVRNGLIPRNMRRAYRTITRESAVARMDELKELVLANEKWTEAKRIYVASLVMMDVVVLSMTRKQAEQVAESVLSAVESAFRPLKWRADVKLRKDSQKLTQMARVVDILEQWWEEHGGDQPLFENILRTEYRLGVKFGFEDPIPGTEDEAKIFELFPAEKADDTIASATGRKPWAHGIGPIASSDITDKYHSKTRRGIISQMRRQRRRSPTSLKKIAPPSSRRFQKFFYVPVDWYI